MTVLQESSDICSCLII